MGTKKVIAAAALPVTALMMGCGLQGQPVEKNVPHGAMARLEIKLEGRICGFGPFVGYYFRPFDTQNPTRLEFWTFNEDTFYSSDAGANILLFEGEAVLGRLPEADFAIPSKGSRINPVFFKEAPPAWVASRPEPQDAFLHFHSCYDVTGPARWGYWLRHRAVKDFTYDMGGRVKPGSPLYHRVKKGPDTDFPRIIEFDSGPGRSTP